MQNRPIAESQVQPLLKFDEGDVDLLEEVGTAQDRIHDAVGWRDEDAQAQVGKPRSVPEKTLHLVDIAADGTA